MQLMALQRCGSLCCSTGLIELRFPCRSESLVLARLHPAAWQRYYSSRGHRRQFKIVTNTMQTGAPGGGDGGSNDDEKSTPLGIGATRLVQLLQARRKDLADRFKSIRRNLPLKVFLLLLGFYSANALATVLGQTGDWDVLVAAIIVAVIEGIGFLMYRTPPLTEKLQFLVRMLNYWKAGLSFGLFVDAFKLGS